VLPIAARHPAQLYLAGSLALRAQVVMVSEAGHYPQSQRPGIATGAVLCFLESVTGRA